MIFVSACFMALLSAWLVTRLMMVWAIPDVPDAVRKLHRAPTPTSGGVGIMAGTVVGLGVFCFYFTNVTAEFSLCLAVSLAGGLLGFWDDRAALGPKIKLMILVAITSGFVIWGARIEALPLWDGAIWQLGPVLGGLGTLLWLLVIVNVVNFMDGANGLSIGSSMVGLVFLSVVCGFASFAHSSPAFQVTIYGLISALACCGFLYWNVAGGRIFAGDSGALFVGLTIGTLGVWAGSMGVNPLSIATCFLPLLADSILTIVWRARQRANLLTPHADHVYQLAIRSGQSHLYVASLYWLATALCGVVAVRASTAGDALISLGFVLCLLPLVLILERARAHYLAILPKQAG